MDLKEIYYRKDLISLSIDSGWLISKNELYETDLECLDPLFSATNLRIGKSVSVEFDEESETYYLLFTEQLRKKGKWDLKDLSNSKTILESSSIDSIIRSLNDYLSNFNDSLISLKVPVWWFIRNNQFLKGISVIMVILM